MQTPAVPSYREIPLTQGKVALVDEADFEWVSQWKWHARYCPNRKSFYAARADRSKGKYINVVLHRELMGLPYGDKRQADHINHDTLNNQRSNLRVCTAAQNAQNRRIRLDGKSGYKGVSFDKQSGKWKASIRLNGALRNLGRFDSPNKAHDAYCIAAAEHFGAFSCANGRD
jgi:hypothetical protein